MASNQLTATSSNSSGQSTQSPQSTQGSSIGATSASGGIQPGTSLDLLKSSGGQTLTQTALPTVNLPLASATQTSTVSSSSPAPVPKHHINVALLSFAGILILAAIVMFITANRSVKTTT
jgi:hypothetical protein